MMSLRLSVFFIILTVCLVAADEKPKENEGEKKPVEGSLLYKSYPGVNAERNITAEKATFKKFVYHRHAERLQAAKNLLKLNDYAKQYEMLDIVFDKMFEVLLEHRVILESSGFIPGDDWPLNMTVRDAMAHVVENTLFFGEIVLRLPDISQKVLSKKKEWRSLITWTWAFSQQCLPYLHEALHLPLNLMAQELGLVDKDDNFYNQFRLENQILEEVSPPKPIGKKKKRSKEKGPRMSSVSAGEL